MRIGVSCANVQRSPIYTSRHQLVADWAQDRRSHIWLVSETGFTNASLGQAREDVVDEFRKLCALNGLKAFVSATSKAGIIIREGGGIGVAEDAQVGAITSKLTRPEDAMDIVIAMGSQRVRVMAVYIPVGEPAKFDSLATIASTLTSDTPLLIGGDWNCVEDPALDASSADVPHSGGAEMRALAETHGLVDLYRHLYRDGTMTTNVPNGRIGTRRRLDRVYASQELVGLARAVLGPRVQAVSSTHRQVTTMLDVPGLAEIGRGHFKLGLHLLEGAAPSLLGARLQSSYSGARTQGLAPLEAWAVAKRSLAQLAQAWSVANARFSRRQGDVSRKVAGAAVRARFGHAPKDAWGEKSVFIRLKQVRAADVISHLVLPSGERATEASSIVAHARAHFEKLYETKPSDDAETTRLLGNLPRRLGQSDKSKLEDDFDGGEVHAAAKSCPRGSSPGPDGIPVEFYLAAWSYCALPLVEVINDIAERDPTSLPPRVAHIHLVPKQQNSDSLLDKRPISMINTDERIFSAAINRRLAPLLQKLTAPSQRGFVPGRWIGDNIAEVLSVVEAKHVRVTGYLAVLDFEKAYDRISHRYLDAVLPAMGLGPRFARWCMATYTGAQAQVFINGWLSSPFDVNSGVRQGDPLSPTLFALAIEPFAQEIRRLVRGLQQPFYLPQPGSYVTGTQGDTGVPSGTTSPPRRGVDLRELLFADDVLVGVRDKSDLKLLESALRNFGKASASRLSATKSFLYPLDGSHGAAAQDMGSWDIKSDKFRYLGVIVGRGAKVDDVWRELAGKLMRRMRMLPLFDVPLASRAKILRIYCYSQAFFVDQFIPAPGWALELLDAAALGVVRRGVRDCPREERLRTPLEHGGFGLTSLKGYLIGRRAMWVRRVLDEDDEAGPNHTRLPRQALQAKIIGEEIELYLTNRSTTTPPTPLPEALGWCAIFCRAGARASALPAANPVIRRCGLTRIGFHGVYGYSLQALPARWEAYIDAWYEVARCTSSFLAQWTTRLTATSWGTHVLRRVTSSSFETLAKDPEDVTDAYLRRQAAYEWRLRRWPVVIPSWQGPLTKHWRRWWRQLMHQRTTMPVQFDTLHRLALRNLTAGDKTGHPRYIAEGHPNAGTTHCALCLQSVVETHDHIFVGCAVSRGIWAKASRGAAHPALLGFVCPPALSERLGGDAMQLRAAFVHYMWKLVRSRRWSSTPVAGPVTADEVAEVALRIHRALPRGHALRA